MRKQSVIDGFFIKKQKRADISEPPMTSPVVTESCLEVEEGREQPTQTRRVENNMNNIHKRVMDPGQRPPIWEYPANERDDVCRAYLNDGPYQLVLKKYPQWGPDYHPRRFCHSWFDLFPDWLEYSPTKDAAFCLLCYIFGSPGSRKPNAFTTEGFRSWGKVRQGPNCAFLKHVGIDHNAMHQKAIEYCKNLMNKSCHLVRVFERQSAKDVENNRMRLKASVDAVRWLALQGCAFRGHNESSTSMNQGNFLELIKFVASYNDEVRDVLDNAPRNAQYKSHRVQKEILCCFARRVQTYIRQEIGEAKFCIIVDESRDESKKEQMAIVIRFVDSDGYIRERFLDIIHVKDTSALTLKNEICEALSQHKLSIHDIRGQGYDGASNMRGEWNGLQALLLEECKYAYYVHCFAHRLQLALVAASRDVIPIYHFFSKLTIAINVVCASSKRNDEFHDAQVEETEEKVQGDEIETGKGLNQISSLQRAGDTRWGSHYSSIRRFLDLFKPACVVINNVIVEGNASQRAEADGIYDAITSFEFVFILHLMERLLGISDGLCKALQYKSQDIVNAMCLVKSTKKLIQNLRDSGWDTLLKNVMKFCEKYEVSISDMSASYTIGRGHRHQQDHTFAHHYRVDIFMNAVDTQLQELESRFNDKAVKLLNLSQALDPRNNFKLFEAEKICELVDSFYGDDFTSAEKNHLRYELLHYEIGVVKESTFHNICTLGELCQKLVETGKMSIYPLIYRLICLVLTLPVSTATSERAFSAMRLVKTRLRSKMNDEFLTSSMIIYIERDIAKSITSDQIIEDFDYMAERRVTF